MKKLFVLSFFCLALPLAVPGLAQTPPVAPAPRVSPEELSAHLREFVPPLLNEWQVPGLAVAVVQGDRVILAEGFGLRDVEQRQPVTPETVFAAGSVTKSFTALTIGLLAEEGKLDWDRPLRTDLPGFRLRDAYAGEHVTPRDLLSHRTGLPGHDLMWYGSPASRDQLLDRLSELEGSAGLRSRFQYQNLMYVTAGALIEKAAGRRWDEVMRERLLGPLGMRASSLSLEALRGVENRASPYERRTAGNGGVEKVPLRSLDAVGPAGALNSNVLDLARWVRLQLGDGRFEGRRVVSGTALRETQTPQAIVRDPSLTRLFRDEGQPYLLYGLGWYVQPYRGHHLLHHGGNIDGFTSFVSFLPQDGVGVVVLSNLGQTYLPFALTFHIYDRLLGLPDQDWSGFFRARRQELEVATEAQRKAEEQDRKLGTRPSHPMEEYAGLYQHPAYGDFRIVRQGMGLGFTFNGLTGTLEHWHYDTWNLPAGQLRGLKLSFLTNARGEVDRLTVPLEASVGDIVFTRRPPAELSDARQLRQYVGEYELSGQSAMVVLQDDGLALSVPGQPTYELVPERGTVFRVKGLTGYSVRFIVEAGEVTAASFVQPSGVFRAVKKKAAG